MPRMSSWCSCLLTQLHCYRLAPGNVEKTRVAPVTEIIANNLRLYDKLVYLFPHNPGMRQAYLESAASIRGSMQAAVAIGHDRFTARNCDEQQRAVQLLRHR